MINRPLLPPGFLLLLFLGAAAMPSFAADNNITNTTISWWLGDYNAGFNAPNHEFVQQHRHLITRVYHCCAGPTMLPNGTISSDSASFATRLRALAVAENMGPAHAPFLPISPNTAALLAGSAVHGVPALVALAIKAAAGGFVVDYEPHQDTTKHHAEAFATFLLALGQGLHGAGLQLAVCISDWGVLNFYDVLSTAKADFYVSMSDTYKSGVEGSAAVARMLLAFPLHTIMVGIGTMVPEQCHCVYGNTGNCTGDYGWTQTSLTKFVQNVAKAGIRHLSVWRADIYPHYCGIDSWMFPIFENFLK